MATDDDTKRKGPGLTSGKAPNARRLGSTDRFPNLSRRKGGDGEDADPTPEKIGGVARDKIGGVVKKIAGTAKDKIGGSVKDEASATRRRKIAEYGEK